MYKKCELRSNDSSIGDVCAYCGTWFRPHVPCAMFDKKSGHAVCDQCAAKYNPRVFEILENCNNYIDGLLDELT